MTPPSPSSGVRWANRESPLKVAEEYALLDNISGGRLIAGFQVGLSYDANQNGAIPAIETRERYNEHRELIVQGVGRARAVRVERPVQEVPGR